METYTLLKVGIAVLATVGLYSVLFKENKFYRFWEHVFVGLSAGWALVAIWTESLRENWWDRMLGSPATVDNGARMGYWPYVVLLPIGLMGYFVFSRKHNWISRIPIGIVLGFYSGQQFQEWQGKYIAQIDDSIKPILPTTAAFFQPSTQGVSPDRAAEIGSQLTISQALGNLIFMITVLSVLSYFLFSFDVKNKILQRTTLTGRWLLMIGFGAIFGSTVMMRFTLLIDRMYFIWIEFLRDGIGRLFGLG